MTCTGSYADSSTQDLTNTVTWAVSDTSIVTVVPNGGFGGTFTVQPAGQVWGATIGVTATLAPGTPGTASMLVISSDSGSVAPRMPQQDSHWQALGLSPWGAYFGLQELTGNLVGSGSAGYTLQVGGGSSFTYGATTPGWTRTGLVMTGSAGIRAAAASGTGPNVNGTSTAWLCYAQVGPSTVSTPIMGLLGASSGQRGFVETDSQRASSGQLNLNAMTRQLALVGPLTMRHDDRIHPLVVIANRTTKEVWSFTDQALIMSGGVTTWFGDDSKGLGAINTSVAAAASATFVFFATATGSIVENLCSPLSASAFLTALGWAPTWGTCPTDSGSIRLPFLANHWKQLGLVPWTMTWNLQEDVGNFFSFNQWSGTLDSGWQGANAAAALTYRLPVAGWTRAGIRFTDAVTDQAVRNANMVISQTGSVAYLSYNDYVTPGANAREVFGQGNTTNFSNQFCCSYGLNGIPVLNCSGSATSGTVDHRDGRIHPTLIVLNNASGTVRLFTDVDRCSGVYGVLQASGTTAFDKGVGGAGLLTTSSRRPGPTTHVYFACATGSIAETLSSDARAHDFLVSLGWSPSWAASATKDATSAVYCPASSAEFLNLGLAPADNIWLCQETTGTLADSAGTAALSPILSPVYSQVIPGWTRKAVAWHDGVADGFSTVTGVPNIATTGYGVMLYAVNANVPASSRAVITMGTATTVAVQLTTDPFYQAKDGLSTANGTVNPGSNVRPIYLQYNFVASNVTVYTDSEVITTTFGAGIGTQLQFGSNGTLLGANGQLLYAFGYQGTNATMTLTSVRQMFRNLGWQPQW